MSGAILLSKDLPTDPFFRRLARAYQALRNSNAQALRPVTDRNAVAFQYETAVTHVLGALAQLWMYADTHLRADNTLDLSSTEIDELVGIPGFCELMPDRWLRPTEDGRVELPDFLEHNGTVARKKASNASRQARYRERQKQSESNATASPPVTDRNAGALPSHPIPSHPSEESLSHSHTRAREEVPREAGAEARPPPTAAVAAFDSLLDDWKRDVPECNPDAFTRWVVHVELQGRQMNPNMRLMQARRLAGNGDFSAQAEVVDWCIENGYKALVPIADVRARRDGLVATGHRKNGTASRGPSLTVEQIERDQAAGLRNAEGSWIGPARGTA